MQDKSPGGKVTITPKIGRKHTMAPSRGEGTLVAKLLEEAGYEGTFEMRLGASLTGSHDKKGVRLGTRGLKNEIVLSVQAGDNTTRRECIVKIPKGTGTPEEYSNRLADVLGQKPTESVEPIVLVEDVLVEKVITEQPLPEIDLEILIVFIDAVQCDEMTIESIRRVLYADIQELRCLDPETFEEHVIKPLLEKGLLLEDNGVYRLTTAGRALLGPARTETLVPLKTGSLSEQVAELEAIIDNAEKARKRMPEIDAEAVRLYATLDQLAKEERELEKVLNDSDLPATEAKLAQIRELLA